MTGVVQPALVGSAVQADRARVARLFHRAGFGASAAEIDTWAARGYTPAVDHLLGFPPAPTRRADEAVVAAVIAAALAADAEGQGIPDLSAFQRWWLDRMATGAYPLEEKLTLYWHGHFATSYQKVAQIRPMIVQNKLLRDMAGGNFRQLCKAITADPAMLVYLDGDQNQANAINENYGREFMELFTLGRNNGYTQPDVVAAARSFTGYIVDPTTGFSSFQPPLHDATPKTLLGNTGRWAPWDVTDIVLDHHPLGPAAATYVAGRMAGFFAHLTPSANMVSAMSQALVASGYQIKAMVRTMLLHPDFMDDPAVGIKSPVELVASVMRALDLGRTRGGVDILLDFSLSDELAGHAGNMGQALFMPPNVAGWKGGAAWANTATLLARYNFAARAAALVASSLVSQVLDAAAGGASTVPEQWMAKLGLLTLSADTRAGIDQYLAAAKAAGDQPNDVARGVLTLLIASPDYNVR